MSVRRGLLIYGSGAVGKSTLELNLRSAVFGNPLTEDDFQCDGRLCFMGKTAKKGGFLMSTGGAEALTPDAMQELPEADWYIAALPVSGRPGTTVAAEFFENLEDVTAVILYSNYRDDYRHRRALFFSGKAAPSIGPSIRSRPAYPPFLPKDKCLTFKTEDMVEAMTECGRILELEVPDSFAMLEDFIAWESGQEEI